MFGSRLSLLTCLIGCGCLLASGCGDGFPQRYPVSGTIRFADGSPVKTGTIELGGNGSRWTASGEIQRDGSFVLTTVKPGDGAVPGEYKIVIRQMVLAYLKAEGGHDHGKLVADRYRDYKTTDLKATVQAGENPPLEIIVK
jgi:hypothetical protein